LIVGPEGFECVKNTPLAKHLDMRVFLEAITARGANCEGKTNEELRKKDENNQT
jgi:hypothetical protein